jgi:hyaluronan synthase
MSPVTLPTAHYSPMRYRVIGGILLVLAAATVVLKIALTAWTVAGTIYIVFLIWVIVQIALAVADRPRHADTRRTPDGMTIAALVPVYNEDVRALRGCLEGFLMQTRRPDAVAVVNDGSSDELDYSGTRDWFLAECSALGVRGHWTDQPNAGKRHAQIAAMRCEPDADIYLTVDSDSILDRHAISEAMKAFADPEVQSVAAVILSTNYRASLLARMMDVFTVGLQLFERSAFSRLNAVMVNSGGCAFYRGAVIRDNVEVYLNETLAGRRVNFSDDSLLTLFALQRGKTVQQPTAFAFTLMPTNLSHHVRQQLRWMRGSFIRSGWRMRFLPLTGTAYWLHLAKWIAYGTVTTTLLMLVVTGKLLDPALLTSGVLAAVTIYVLTAFRYLAVVRSDQSTAQRWLTFATSPLAALWGLTFLRVLRWYAMATVLNLGWGTRSVVEVHADA